MISSLSGRATPAPAKAKCFSMPVSKKAPSTSSSGGKYVWSVHQLGVTASGNATHSCMLEEAVVGEEDVDEEESLLVEKEEWESVESRAHHLNGNDDLTWFSPAVRDELLQTCGKRRGNLASAAELLAPEGRVSFTSPEILRPVKTEDGEDTERTDSGHAAVDAIFEDMAADSLAEENVLQSRRTEESRLHSSTFLHAMHQSLSSTNTEDGDFSHVAARNEEMTPRFGMIFKSLEHADAWVRLWGASNMPMRVLPGGNASKRVYVCRSAQFCAFGHRRQSFKVVGSCANFTCRAFFCIQRVVGGSLLKGKFHRCRAVS